jgi:PD-(D/E)XK endonuclease
MFKSRKEQGEWVEMQFMARAAANGFTVSKPWGDSSRYDFAIENEGRFQRVQVKSTSSRDGASYACNTIWSAPNGRSRRYSAKDVDFFAIFVIPDEAWYIIPLAQLTRARTCFFLNPRNPKNRYFRYLEAWHLLKAAVSN